LKILCLSRAPLDYIGGIPSYCISIYGGGDFEVQIYSYDLSKGLEKKLKRNFKGLKEIIFPSIFRIGTFAFSIQYIYSIIKFSSKYDFIHLQLPDPVSVLSVLITKLFNPKIKVIVTWHAEIYKNYILFAPILFILDLLISISSHKIIFFTKGHIKKSTLNRFKFLRGKMKLIPCAIPAPKNKNIPVFAKDINKKNLINLVSIGRLVEYKGYEYAIKAIKNCNENVNYRIIGFGPKFNELTNLINKLKLQNRVTLLGQLSDEDKEKILADSDIFIFPSINQSEAYGLVQLEAMFFGLPIINTNLNNGVNYLASNATAVTCPVKESESLSKAIYKLINDKNLYKRLSQNALSNVKKYSLEDMRKSYLNLFS